MIEVTKTILSPHNRLFIKLNWFISFIHKNQQLIADILVAANLEFGIIEIDKTHTEVEDCQEAIVVVGEASESEDSEKSPYRSDSSLNSRSNSNSNPNLTTISLTSAKSVSLNLEKSSNSSLTSPLSASFLAKKLSIREDRFTGNESNLINERLAKDNRLFRNAIVSFGTQRYQQTINELNELNQNLIKSQEKLQNTSQYTEKTKLNLNNLNDNLDQLFNSFDNCKLKI